MNKTKEVWLTYLLLAGFVVRVLFLLCAPEVLPGERSFYMTSDSFSYTESFLNLLQSGVYSFDLSHPDAAFGRLPGYPFFWGIHFLIFGENWVYQAVAFSQAALDSLSILFLYRISFKLSKNSKLSLLVALIHAFNPFFIYWVPVTGTETLASFTTILFFYVLFCKSHWTRYALSLGLLGIIAFYIRPYLALLMPIAALYLLMKNKAKFLVPTLKMSLVFILLFSLWPIRNYVNYGRPILVKTQNAGYYRYAPDVYSCRAYLNTWTTELDYYMDDVFLSDNEYTLPPEAIPDGVSEAEIKETVALARNCGSGFKFWNHEGISIENNCDVEVAEKFNRYKDGIYSSNPWSAHTLVPLQNLKKILFKSQTKGSSKASVERILFGIRSSILLLSLLGLVVGVCKMNPEITAIATFTFLMYVLIAYVVRQVEMRYLLQADLAVTPAIAYLVHLLISSRAKKAMDNNIVAE